MKNIILFSAASLALGVACASVACSSSNNTSTGGSTTTTTNTGTTTSTTGTKPAPPTLGQQIDRMGRPAINTALNHSFDADAGAAGAAKDAYNQNGTPTGWGTAFVPQIAQNLAVLDALDGVCGNQPPGYAADAGTATSYATLATVLANDALWVNTAGTTCTTYLAVEVNALGLKTNTDCGGRGLGYDVIDASYSALAAGDLTGAVKDGVAGNDGTFSAIFPYLAGPH